MYDRKERGPKREVPNFCAVDLTPCNGMCARLHASECKEKVNPKDVLSGRQYRQLLQSCPIIEEDKSEAEEDMDSEAEFDE